MPQKTNIILTVQTSQPQIELCRPRFNKWKNRNIDNDEKLEVSNCPILMFSPIIKGKYFPFLK